MFNSNSKNILAASGVSVFVAFLFWILFASAPSIAVFHVDSVLDPNVTDVAKSIEKIVQDTTSDITKKMTEIKGNIDKEEKELELNKSNMKKSAIEEAEKSIQTQKANLQGLMSYYDVISKHIRSVGFAKVSERLSTLVPSIAKSYGYEYVLYSGALAGFIDLNKDKKYDITVFVVEELNKSMPSVDPKEILNLEQ